MKEKLDIKRIFHIYARKITVYLAALALVSAAIAARAPKTGAVMLALCIFAGFYEIIIVRRQRTKFLNYIETLSFSLDGATKDAILHFPDPMVIVDDSGRISWYNKGYADIFPDIELYEMRLPELFPSMKFSKIVEEGAAEFGYLDKTYGVIKHDVSFEDGRLMVLYFTDKTEEARLRRKCDDESMVSCIIMIDNHDEVLQNTPNANHASLLGDVEATVREWVGSLNGVMRKYERDKYWVAFEKKDLVRAIDARFEILDIIREINDGNKIPVTLSIGIGSGGAGAAEKDRYAVSAIEMALGRGGDQAVVKDGESFHFYGAKSREVEKRTKVKARVVAHAFRELVLPAARVIIAGHANSDMDSIGAAVGLSAAIRGMGKDAYIVLGRNSWQVSELVNILEQHPEYSDKFITPEQAENIYDKETVVVLVDTHRPSLTDVPNLLKESQKTVLIDHHRRSEDFLDNAILTYHEPYASSTCEMVTEMLQYIDGQPDLARHEAQALYAGLVLDTKNFTFKTGVRTFEAASYLRRMGVDTVEVHRLFQKDLADFIKKAKIISGTEWYHGNIAIASVEKVEGDLKLIAAQTADDLLGIKDVAASFVLSDAPGGTNISGRSLGDINVQVILEKLGGGGHMTVAGAQVDVKIKTARERLKKAIDEVLGVESKE